MADFTRRVVIANSEDGKSVMRGCRHTWVNRGSEPAVTAFVLIDSAPVRVGSELLAPVFPAPR